MSTDDGVPAFPYVLEHMEQPHMVGMSLRDYFAAKAMQAIIGCYHQTMRGVENAKSDADADLTSFSRDLAIDTNHGTGENEGCKEIAGDAYAFADAMLAARKGKP